MVAQASINARPSVRLFEGSSDGRTLDSLVVQWTLVWEGRASWSGAVAHANRRSEPHTTMPRATHGCINEIYPGSDSDHHWMRGEKLHASAAVAGGGWVGGDGVVVKHLIPGHHGRRARRSSLPSSLPSLRFLRLCPFVIVPGACQLTLALRTSVMHSPVVRRIDVRSVMGSGVALDGSPG